MVLNAYDKAAIKNAAKAVAHYEAKKETLVKKQEELQKEIDTLNTIIEGYSKTVVEKVGYSPLQLVKKEGNNWVFIYPDTITPPETQESTIELRDLDAEENKDWDEKTSINDNPYAPLD